MNAKTIFHTESLEASELIITPRGAIYHINLRPEEMIYVGDDPNLDIDAAAKLGIHTVWFDHGKKAVANYKPNAIITDIRQLPVAIRDLVRSHNKH